VREIGRRNGRGSGYRWWQHDNTWLLSCLVILDLGSYKLFLYRMTWLKLVNDNFRELCLSDNMYLESYRADILSMGLVKFCGTGATFLTFPCRLTMLGELHYKMYYRTHHIARQWLLSCWLKWQWWYLQFETVIHEKAGQIS
jgi:hypothetical protein